MNIDLTQFIVNNGLEQRPILGADSMLTGQSSPRSLHIDSDYIASTQHPDEIPIGTHVSQLAVSPDQLSQPMSQLANSQVQSQIMLSSQPLLGHEEVVATTTQHVDEIESEVMREVRDLISNVRPEGWLETDTQTVKIRLVERE